MASAGSESVRFSLLAVASAIAAGVVFALVPWVQTCERPPGSGAACSMRWSSMVAVEGGWALVVGMVPAAVAAVPLLWRTDKTLRRTAWALTLMFATTIPFGLLLIPATWFAWAAESSVGRGAERRAKAREASLNWQTRSRLVWSDYGGRRRQVKVEWRPEHRGLERFCLRVFLGLIYVLAMIPLSFGIATLLGLLELGPERGDRDVFPDYELVVFLTFCALVTLGHIVWSLAQRRHARRRRRRAPSDGAIVLRELATGWAQYDELYSEPPPEIPYLAVDDGTTDTVTAFAVHPEVYAHLREGDVVRVLWAEGDEWGTPVEPLHDTHGRPLPLVGTMPATPEGAPLTTDEVAECFERTVRSVETATTEIGGQTIQSWTYHLIDDRDPVLWVHVASGGQAGADAITDLVSPTDTTTEPEHRVGDSAERYPDSGLLVARQGAAVVGLHMPVPPASPLYDWWDNILGRQALTRITNPPPP